VLATRAGLSADTIRRLEKGSFAASIETIRKLCIGLDISPSTLFESFELNQTDGRRALIDLVAARGNDEIALVIRVVRALLDELDKLRVERQ
jgi:transcriptional regulator with XRE-family HTH domain